MADPSTRLVVVSAVHGDPVVAELRRRHPGESTLVQNPCHARVTLDVAYGANSDRILLEGRTLAVDDLRAIVVSGMSCGAGLEHSPEDTRYIEYETFAVWTALLHKAACPVINRPVLAALPPGLSPLQVRAVASREGVPTLRDELLPGTELERRREQGFDAACLDLDAHVGFWLRSARVLDPARLYSLTNLAVDDRELVVAWVRGQCDGYTFRVDDAASASPATRAELDEAKEASRLVAGLLGLDYGFFTFRVGPQRLEFCRAFSHWVGLHHAPVVSFAAGALLEQLEAA